MKIEDFEKTKDELNIQKKENDKRVSINNKKVKILQINQLDYKLQNIFAYSLLPYLGLILGVMGLSSLIGINTLSSVISPLIIPVILESCSLCIGVIGTNLMYKKYKIKEKYNSFSKSKTEAEKVEEEISYQIELEKANNRSKILEQAISSLDSKEALLRSFSSEYDINEKNVSQTEEQTKKRLDELSEIVEQKYKELDVLTTQKVLSKNFWKLRCKDSKRIDLMVAFMIGGFMTMLINVAPLMVIREALTYNSAFATFAVTLAPFVIGAVGVGGYWIKKNKNREIAFNKLNNTLGEKSLPEKREDIYNETQNLESMIESKINDISIAEIQLRKQRRTLENIASEQVKTDINNKELEQKNLFLPDAKTSICQQSMTKSFNLDVMLDTTNIVEETKSSEKSHTLVKRR